MYAGKPRFRILRAFGTLALSGMIAFVGCADRIDSEEEVELPEELLRANDLLANAEAAMANASVALDFSDPSKLEELQETMPDPNAIKEPAVREEMQTAISSFNGVFDETGTPIAPLATVPFGAPSQLAGIGLSSSDEALIHFYLSYLYSLDAVSRLAEVGADLFQVEYPRNLDTGEIYNFVLNIDVPNLAPEEVLSFFNAQQRQAVVDAIRVLTGGTVSADGQLPAVDSGVFRRSALFHLDQAASIIGADSQEIEDAIAELNDSVREQLSIEILREVESWGFVIEQLPAELISLVTAAQ